MPEPQVANYVQLTHDGLQKSLIGIRWIAIVPDDRRFRCGRHCGRSGHGWRGDTNRDARAQACFPWIFRRMVLRFLWWKEPGIPRKGRCGACRCWGGRRRRLGDAAGHVAAWSADGKLLAFGKDAEVYLAKGDGTDVRKLATMRNLVSGLAISPDGSRVQVETEEISQSGTSVVVGERSIWEVSAKGSEPTALIPEWQNTNEVLRQVDSGREVFRFPVRGADLGAAGREPISAEEGQSQSN